MFRDGQHVRAKVVMQHVISRHLGGGGEQQGQIGGGCNCVPQYGVRDAAGVVVRRDQVPVDLVQHRF